MSPCVPFITQCNSAVRKNMMKGAARDPHSGQLLVLFKPQSFKRFGVRTQLTEASKTNLTIRGLIPPQIMFFQLMSKGKAFSAHCSQAACCLKKLNELFFVVQKSSCFC